MANHCYLREIWSVSLKSLKDVSSEEVIATFASLLEAQVSCLYQMPIHCYAEVSADLFPVAPGQQQTFLFTSLSSGEESIEGRRRWDEFNKG